MEEGGSTAALRHDLRPTTISGGLSRQVCALINTHGVAGQSLVIELVDAVLLMDATTGLIV
jgi:hypothetical protein